MRFLLRAFIILSIPGIICIALALWLGISFLFWVGVAFMGIAGAMLLSD